MDELARIIAAELGDDFDHAHRDKPHWIETRGESGGRYRDINEPRQSDYLAAANAVRSYLLSEERVEAAAKGMEKARCPHREGPFGGYDYGHDNPNPVKGGRYVIRDFRDPSSPEWGKWINQTDDRDLHEAMFEKMTKEHIARAAITAAIGEGK